MATEEKSDISEILTALKRGKWVVLFCFSGGLLLGGLYILQAPYVYRADAVLQVAKSPTSIGPAGNDLLEENDRLFVETEKNILQSNSILSRVVDSLGLYIDVQPRYFPLLGRISAKRAGPEKTAASPPFGLKGYCWGPEKLAVETFSPPQRDFGKTFKLVATGNGGFDIFFPDGRLLSSGGHRPAAGDSSGPLVRVKSLQAHAGAEFYLVRKTVTAAVESLRDHLEIYEQGTNSGILRLTLFGRDPAMIRQSLDTLTGIYIQQKNNEKKNHINSTLAILRGRLPEAQKDLQNAETAVQRFQQKFGTVSPDNLAETLYDRTIEIDKQLSGLALKQLEYEQKYKNSKSLDLLRRQQQALQEERQSIERKLATLPEGRQTGLKRHRDLDMAEAMYRQLVSEIERLELARQDVNRDVRIVDPAVVYDKPVEPRKRVVLALGAFIGFFGGFFFILIRNMLLEFHPVSPMWLEDRTGLPVFSSIPRLSHMKKLPPLSSPPFKRPLVKYFQHIYVQLGQCLDHPVNTIAVTSWNEGAGKSLISHFLAQTFALMGHKVLLADVSTSRRQLFRDKSGLAEITSGSQALQQTLHPIEVYKNTRFDFLPRGLQDHPLEPLSDISKLLENWLLDYDYIILDTPAIYEHADVLAVLKAVHVNLLVVRDYQNTVENTLYCKRYVERAGARLTGMVLNHVPQTKI